MVFESLLMRALVAGVLVGAPRWRNVRPKTAPACMSHTRGREIETQERESARFSPEYAQLMALAKDSCSGSGSALHRIERVLYTSRECQVVASFIQLALMNDSFLNTVDRKLEQGKLGLSASERDHVNSVLKEVWLDREGRRNKELLESAYVLLYADIHGKIAQKDGVVAGSGNNNKVLLSPERLKDKVFPKIEPLGL